MSVPFIMCAVCVDVLTPVPRGKWGFVRVQAKSTAIMLIRVRQGRGTEIAGSSKNGLSDQIMQEHIKQPRSQSAHGGNAYTSANFFETSDVRTTPWESTYTVHDGNFFTAVFASSSVIDICDVVEQVKRRGRIKSGMPMFQMRIPQPSVLLEMLTDDSIHCIIDHLCDERDLLSVANLRCTCHALALPARSALSSLTRASRIEALVRGTLPADTRVLVEHDAGTALVDGCDLDLDVIEALYDLARKAVASLPSAWTLSAEQAGTDPENDLSFKLRGFGDVPKAPEEEQEHLDETSAGVITHTRLPCVLAGPRRYLALSGSARQQRAMRPVPLTSCRIINAPEPSSHDVQSVCGVVLVTTILQCASCG